MKSYENIHQAENDPEFGARVINGDCFKDKSNTKTKENTDGITGNICMSYLQDKTHKFIIGHR